MPDSPTALRCAAGIAGRLPHPLSMAVEREAMRRHSRRELLRSSLALAGFSLLSGCEMPGRQAAKVPRIGLLAVGTREGRAFMIEGFLQGLREHGYVDGQNQAARGCADRARRPPGCQPAKNGRRPRCPSGA
jgi:hypothetical protein